MDTLFYNGTIRTMDSLSPMEALSARDDRILELGGLAQLDHGAVYDRKVDLHGACLMPAFMDAHSHLIGWAMEKLKADLSSAKTFDDIAGLMGEFAKTPQGQDSQWVIGAGANMLMNEGLVEKLDRVLPDRPCVVTHVSGHGGVFNTAGQKLLGLSQGAMVENAFIDAECRIPSPNFASLKAVFEEGQEDYIRQGYVLAQEGCVNANAAPLYKALSAADAMKMTIVGYAQQDLGLPLDKGPLPTAGFTIRGDKIFLDGSPQQRTAYLREPYIGGGLGEATMTDEQVLAAVRSAKEGGRQLLAHCNGDAAIDRYLWALEEGGYPAELRPVVIHGQLMQYDQLKKVKELGAVVSYFVAHTRHWGDDHIRNLGDRAMTISPVRSTLDMGIPVTFHQDTPVLPPYPLEPVACAALRRTASGAALSEKEKISVYEGLQIMTRGAAYQYHEENERGTLEPGKRADFVILDRDPVTTPAEELESIRVLATISGGEVLWRDPHAQAAAEL